MLGVVGVSIGLAVVFVLLRGGTPSIHDTDGRVPPRALTELKWLSLGGARQAVLLRGADTTKPVVLFLHGGP